MAMQIFKMAKQIWIILTSQNRIHTAIPYIAQNYLQFTRLFPAGARGHLHETCVDYEYT